MNWYKISISLSDFEDRNILNRQIRLFKEYAEILYYLTKYVYQNAPHARRTVYQIATDKKMSSFPNIKDLLLEAYRVGLDSYKKFADFCRQALVRLRQQIKTMEQQRKEFVEETLPQRTKEKFENA